MNTFHSQSQQHIIVPAVTHSSDDEEEEFKLKPSLFDGGEEDEDEEDNTDRNNRSLSPCMPRNLYHSYPLKIKSKSSRNKNTAPAGTRMPPQNHNNNNNQMTGLAPMSSPARDASFDESFGDDFNPFRLSKVSSPTSVLEGPSATTQFSTTTAAAEPKTKPSAPPKPPVPPEPQSSHKKNVDEEAEPPAVVPIKNANKPVATEPPIPPRTVDCSQPLPPPPPPPRSQPPKPQPSIPQKAVNRAQTLPPPLPPPRSQPPKPQPTEVQTEKQTNGPTSRRLPHKKHSAPQQTTRDRPKAEILEDPEEIATPKRAHIDPSKRRSVRRQRLFATFEQRKENKAAANAFRATAPVTPPQNETTGITFTSVPRTAISKPTRFCKKSKSKTKSQVALDVTRLEKLRLYIDDYTDSTFFHLLAKLSTHQDEIRKLDIYRSWEGHRRRTSDEMHALFETIGCLPNLETLMLSNMEEADLDANLRQMVSAESSLKHLSLHLCEGTLSMSVCRGVSSLPNLQEVLVDVHQSFPLHVLLRSSSIQRIQLFENDYNLENSHLVALVKAMEKNTTLIDLELEPGMSLLSFKLLANALRVNNGLQALKFNLIPPSKEWGEAAVDYAIQDIVGALRQNRTLQMLWNLQYEDLRVSAPTQSKILAALQENFVMEDFLLFDVDEEFLTANESITTTPDEERNPPATSASSTTTNDNDNHSMGGSTISDFSFLPKIGMGMADFENSSVGRLIRTSTDKFAQSCRDLAEQAQSIFPCHSFSDNTATTST